MAGSLPRLRAKSETCAVAELSRSVTRGIPKFMCAQATRTNHLIDATSPYLLQHAHNPVDWYPWGEEALARARREDKPILLSIGYAACHWCHVMERESFENEATAARMNRHFVCIKVDREERPDLDDIYMAATVAMSGQGGWPMTVFLTPDQRPFFAGTYFPPQDRYGRPGFPTLLDRIAEVWTQDRQGVEAQATQLTAAVRTQLESVAPEVVSGALIARAAEQLSASYDDQFGGFGSAPKFPPSQQLRLLLRHHHFDGSKRALDMVRGTLDGMKNGGIYDHVGGGFARYSTDQRWHVPHFEKMLYDNAQLARVYIEAFEMTDDPEYARVARETLDYALREMQSPQGGFYSATDADSEGVEGKFFTFTREQLAGVLEEPLLSRFCAYYGVTPEGNWEGTNVLWTPRPLADVADSLGIAPEALTRQLALARERVYAARARRVAPLLDDKILVSWNGLMISALAEASRVLDVPGYREAAERAARDLLHRLKRPDGGLFRTARGEQAALPAYLEDYAFLGSALLDLYESGSEELLLHQAAALCERMLQDFGDATQGGFYQTAHDHESLIARPRDAQDDALPNASAVAAELCARLSYHLDRPDLRDRAAQTARCFGKLLQRAPRAFASMLMVVDLIERGPLELALVGSKDDPKRRALERAAASAYVPYRVIAHAEAPSALPLLRDRVRPGDAAIYLCKNFVCEAPIRDPSQLLQRLAPESRP